MLEQLDQPAKLAARVEANLFEFIPNAIGVLWAGKWPTRTRLAKRSNKCLKPRLVRQYLLTIRPLVNRTWIKQLDASRWQFTVTYRIEQATIRWKYSTNLFIHFECPNKQAPTRGQSNCETS